jgi:hypothetical protein
MKMSLCSAAASGRLRLSIEIGDRQFGARGAEVSGAAVRKTVLVGDADNKALFAA